MPSRCGDTVALVTEPVENPTPLLRLDQKPLPDPEQAARWVAEIAEAFSMSTNRVSTGADHIGGYLDPDDGRA